MSLTAVRLRALLREPGVPWGSTSIRANQPPTRGRRMVALADLTRFVRDREGDEPGLEERVDVLMRSLPEVEAFQLVDPWSLPKRLLLKALGRRTPQMVAYEVADAFFER